MSFGVNPPLSKLTNPLEVNSKPIVPAVTVPTPAVVPVAVPAAAVPANETNTYRQLEIASQQDIINQLRLQTLQAEQTGLIHYCSGSKKEISQLSQPKLTARQKEKLELAKKYSLELSIKGVMIKQQVSHQQNQAQNFQATMQRQQAVALMCRVYVGSIFYEVNEAQIRAAFLPFGPIKAITMPYDAGTNKHKGFAFVEYELPESAQLSVDQMNGAQVGGRSIKVGRPTNMPQALPVISQLAEEAAKANRIFVSSIHPELSETDLMSVFGAFGEVRCVELASPPDHSAKHAGYAFIEYLEATSAHEAISSMNFFDLGGQLLRVGRASTPSLLNHTTVANTESMPTAAAVAAATISAKISQMAIPSADLHTVAPPQVVIPQLSTATSSKKPPPPPPSSEENLLEAEDSIAVNGREARTMVMQKLMKTRKKPNTVMCLRNMVGPEDIDDALEHEITEECAKYGTVVKVIIYQERGEFDPNQVTIKILVQFADESSQNRACDGLNKRWFAGRLVQADTYDQDAFDSNDYSQ